MSPARLARGSPGQQPRHRDGPGGRTLRDAELSGTVFQPVVAEAGIVRGVKRGS
jgi:hypothetical protein